MKYTMMVHYWVASLQMLMELYALCLQCNALKYRSVDFFPNLKFMKDVPARPLDLAACKGKQNKASYPQSFYLKSPSTNLNVNSRISSIVKQMIFKTSILVVLISTFCNIINFKTSTNYYLWALINLLIYGN